jgi:Fe-S-cluster containining protein
VIDPATSACAGCSASCCSEHDVEVNGFDLLRLMNGLGMPWDAIVRVEIQPHALFAGFRLDSGPQHHHFYLKRRESGACQFLLELSPHRRCGVHGLRPGACRLYPLRPNESGSVVGSHALCPPPQRELYQLARPKLQAIVDEDSAAEAKWFATVREWDEKMVSVARGQPLPMAEFLDWLAARP